MKSTSTSAMMQTTPQACPDFRDRLPIPTFDRSSGEHNRVLYLTLAFHLLQAAMRHATHQGFAWVGTPPASPTLSS